MDSILEVNGLVKRYPAFFLDNISFSLPEGCVLGFIGANGAGKTTTIRSILNLAHKDAGTIKNLRIGHGEARTGDQGSHRHCHGRQLFL